MDFQRYIEQNEGEAAALLRALCAIPAPSHKEEKRAAFCKAWLEAHGAAGVFIDEAQNAVYPYRAEQAEAIVLFMAHTDTVFPDTEPMALTERDGKMFCPGVGDDTANVALLLLTAAYVAQARPETSCGIVFALNSCEEGLGNLKGSRALLARYGDRLREVVSFDGYMEELCGAAVGSLRYRVTVRTAGGHSFSNFGSPNAIERLSAVVERLYAYAVPQNGSRTTFNVGQISGGTSVNTIAQQAEMLYELRSDDRDSLLSARRYFESVLESFRADGLGVETELLGERPCGEKTGATRGRQSFCAAVPKACGAIRASRRKSARCLRTATSRFRSASRPRRSASAAAAERTRAGSGLRPRASKRAFGSRPTSSPRIL